MSMIRNMNESNNNEKGTYLEKIRFVYAQYIDFYKRVPVYPDHLMSFGNKIHMRLSYKSTKEFLDIRAQTQSAPPTLNKLRFGQLSVSSPTLINKSQHNMKQTEVQNEDNNLYTLTETELLQCIKDKINAALT